MIGSLQYVMGRDPEIYPDPDTFLPERWLRGSEAISSEEKAVIFLLSALWLRTQDVHREKDCRVGDASSSGKGKD